MLLRHAASIKPEAARWKSLLPSLPARLIRMLRGPTFDRLPAARRHPFPGERAFQVLAALAIMPWLRHNRQLSTPACLLQVAGPSRHEVCFMSRLPRFVLHVAAAAMTASVSCAAEPAKPPAGKVSYYKDIRPIFQQHCQGCHQPAKAQGDYVMTGYDELFKGGNSGKEPIVKGKADASHIVQQISPQKDKPPAMPKGKEPLPDHMLQKIKLWIADGAADDTPPSIRKVAIDADHPPAYELAPVITSIDFSPDGKLLAVAGYHEVLLHKADGSGLEARLVGASERIQSLTFSPDGKTLAVSGGNPGRFGEIQLWDVAKRELKMSVPMTFDTVNGVSWSPDGTKIAFGCNDNTVRAIDAATGQQVLYQGAHNDWVLDTTFSLDGTFLVSVSRDRSMKLIEVATNRFIDNITSITPGALKGGLGAVALRPLKERKMVKRDLETGGGEHLYNELLVGGSDGVPRLYRMHRQTKRVIGDDANRIREFEAMPGRIYSVAFNTDGSLLAAASSSDGTGEVRVYQAADGKKVSTFAGERGGVYAVKFRPDGKAVASAGFDGVIRLNDPMTGKLIKEFVPVPMAKGK
jgi:WD40 repeat protein